MNGISDVLLEVGASLGLENFRLDEQGTCQVSLDGRLAVLQEVASVGQLLTVMRAGPLPLQGAGVALHRLMGVSYDETERQGVVVSLDPETHEVCLHRYDGLVGLTAEGYLTGLETLVDRFDEVRAILDGEGASPGENDGASGRCVGDRVLSEDVLRV